ncbi:MAG: cation diffusion facilitator family transporter [Anaerolineaceae bacterium]|nr:MAG: cation diffusion facilitator family transporter [Anaerolineaceae bacterium]
MTTHDAGIPTPTGDHEKKLVARSSVLAAVFLTLIKLVIGIITGSLGILSEAAHSGLDLVAAGVTWFAVSVSSSPPDSEHTYGHGKIENLSALFETFLLLLTCLWIIYEAIQRLFFKEVEVEANFWAFLVMATSIVVDISRSRALYRVARKYKSQALEADALHFATDIWSSAVVIGGLTLVRLSDVLGVEWLVKADAIAALAVAGIVIYVSAKLGIRTISALLDAVPAGLQDEIVYVAHVPGVLKVKRARVRIAGPEAFADLTLMVRHDTTLEQAHEIADQAEEAVRQILPGADVVVHIEPLVRGENGIVNTVRRLAANHGMSTHALRIYDVAERRLLELHIEVEDSLSVDEAHAKVSIFESEIRSALPSIDQVVSHIEPIGEPEERQRGSPDDESLVYTVLQELKERMGQECRFHQVEVHRTESELFVTLHCTVDPDTAIVDAHTFTEEVESELRSRIPQLNRVVIHVEPPDADEA